MTMLTDVELDSHLSGVNTVHEITCDNARLSNYR